MTLFLTIAALLTAVALVAVLLPLLRKPREESGAEATDLSLRVLREQLGELESECREGTLDPAQYEKECAEIERRALEDGAAPAPAPADRRRTWLAAATAVAVCAAAIGLYALLGTPAAFQPPAAGHAQQNAHAVSPQQIEAMVGKLALRLQDNPADGEGWLMLARSYNALGRFPEASAAYGRAFTLLPPDAQHLADYADTLAMAQGRRLAGEPEKIIARALAADPRNIKALALAGSAAFERQDYAAAIAEWRKVLAIVPAESTIAARIGSSIADAEQRAGGGVPSIAAAQPAAPGQPAAGALSGVVALDSNLRGQVADGDTVFVFARAAEGPRMPVAIKRLTVRELPARFVLDDSMSMAGGPKLSEQKQVIVGARVSRSGNATPQSGDLEGHAEAIAPGSANVRVTISRAVP
jgi:cytochrome c-type biogenesis protein CcmH